MKENCCIFFIIVKKKLKLMNFVEVFTILRRSSMEMFTLSQFGSSELKYSQLFKAINTSGFINSIFWNQIFSNSSKRLAKTCYMDKIQYKNIQFNIYFMYYFWMNS